METNEQVKVAESQNKMVNNNAQSENVVVDTMVESCAEKPTTINNKKPLTPYQKYKNSRNQNGKKYFDFYDDIKVYTHNIWDW